MKKKNEKKGPTGTGGEHSQKRYKKKPENLKNKKAYGDRAAHGRQMRVKKKKKNQIRRGPRNQEKDHHRWWGESEDQKAANRETAGRGKHSKKKKKKGKQTQSRAIQRKTDCGVQSGSDRRTRD